MSNSHVNGNKTLGNHGLWITKLDDHDIFLGMIG